MKVGKFLLLVGVMVCLVGVSLGVAGGSTVKGMPMKAGHVFLTPEEIPWSPAPAVLSGSQISVIEGNPSKGGPVTMRVKFPANYRIPPHWHPGIEHVTVISGTFNIGLGTKWEENKGKPLPVGSFVVIPAKHPHFAWASEETVIQIHTMGPWGLTFVNPKDKAGVAATEGSESKSSY